jgi:hypothetical protein
MINFYKQLPNDLKNNNNKLNKETNMALPWRGIIVGSSGSGKTNLILNIIKLHSGLYDLIVLCTRNSDEPLYNFIKRKIPKDNLIIIEDLNNLGEPEEYKSDSQTLIIFDDLCLEKDQTKIAEFFIRGRKLNISSVYLTQSYTKCDITVRRQAGYIFLKKIPNNKDITTIINDFSINVDKKEMLKEYKKCTEDSVLGFMMIDINATDDKRFRCGFTKTISF